jgi:hypothetical protein
MTEALIIAPSSALQAPTLFTPTPKAAQRVLEFFTAQINNDHTRRAYLNATRRFAASCDVHGLHELTAVRAVPHRVLRQGTTRHVHAAHGEAAPGRTAHAVRLAGDGPCERNDAREPILRSW